MRPNAASLHLVDDGGSRVPADAEQAQLDLVFSALGDPVRRAVLERLGDGPLLVSELAAPFDISLQAVSRHIQVLVRAGLVEQERSGRVSRCSLAVGPIFAAAVWINRYSRYWQAQFDVLAGWLGEIEHRGSPPGRPRVRSKVDKASQGRRRR